MNLTRPVRQINVHGAKLAVQYHGVIPEFVSQDIYAAMAGLDPCACAMGLAIYEDTDHAIHDARVLGHA